MTRVGGLNGIRRKDANRVDAEIIQRYFRLIGQGLSSLQVCGNAGGLAAGLFCPPQTLIFSNEPAACN
jgi:hypothetical protein